MERMSWKDGWHDVDSRLSIYIENGEIVRGMVKKDIGCNTVYPYLPSKYGGLDRAYHVKANKRNFEKLSFR